MKWRSFLICSILAFPLIAGGIVSASDPQSSHSVECGTISGVVIDENEVPIPNATVYAMLSGNKPNRPLSSRLNLPVSSRADETGRFTLQNIPAGTVYLDAAKEEAGYVHSIFAFYLTPEQKKPILKIQCGEKIDGATIKLGPKAAYLKLHVHDETGKPVGATMTLSRPDMGEVGTLGTSFVADSLFPVPPVPFHLAVQALGFQEWKYSALISLKPGEVFPLDVSLQRDQDGAVHSFDPQYGHALIPAHSIAELLSTQPAHDALAMAPFIQERKEQLLTPHFRPEGGLSTYSHRIYVAKSYPYLKIEVSFLAPVSGERGK